VKALAGQGSVRCKRKGSIPETGKGGAGLLNGGVHEREEGREASKKKNLICCQCKGKKK